MVKANPIKTAATTTAAGAHAIRQIKMTHVVRCVLAMSPTNGN